MDTKSPNIEQLKASVSRFVMRPMTNMRDFEYLYGKIQENTKETVGLTTLRRLWGHIDGYSTVRETTLDVLCRFIGFPDWHTFVSDHCGETDTQTSHRILSATLNVGELSVGDVVTIEWNPGRRIILRHEGDGYFCVTEAFNSKICAGDRFHCEWFVLGQPLYIDNLVHEGDAPTLFVVGKMGGLTKVELQAKA